MTHYPLISGLLIMMVEISGSAKGWGAEVE